MDICELRDKLFGRGVTEAAMKLDADSVRALEQRYQKEWEDGKSYLGIAAMSDTYVEQGPDQEREAEAIAEQLQLDLECVVHDHWLSSMKRGEVIALCKKLKQTQAVYTLCQGAEYTAEQIAFDWNDIFPLDPILPKDIAIKGPERIGLPKKPKIELDEIEITEADLEDDFCGTVLNQDRWEEYQSAVKELLTLKERNRSVLELSYSKNPDPKSDREMIVLTTNRVPGFFKEDKSAISHAISLSDGFFITVLGDNKVRISFSFHSIWKDS